MRLVFLTTCAILTLAGCSTSTVPVQTAPTAAVAPPAKASAGSGYTTVYRFKNVPDAAYPNAGVIAGTEVLYGTTNTGGKRNLGTVFIVTTNGRERRLYEFQGGSDGKYPDATVAAMSGALFGTTTEGGADNLGVVYEITPSGNERVLHAFSGGSDGSTPYDALLAYRGALYGTTSSGGAHGGGTAFEIDQSKKFRVLYSFGATQNDGQTPMGGLIVAGGVLYGTTYSGGTYGEGSVFSLTVSGENILYSFGSVSGDAANPRASLTYANGTLYGTTQDGGMDNDGTVFSIAAASGKETVLHSFGGDPDGQNPYDALIFWHGTLYGTTYGGGNTGGCSQFHGCGTIFNVRQSGSEAVLYNFQSNPDGSGPWGGVTLSGGALYGAASTGGNGCGTIFRIALR